MYVCILCVWGVDRRTSNSNFGKDVVVVLTQFVVWSKVLK